MERATLTARELAEYLGVSLPTAYQAMHSPGFPLLKIGRKLLAIREELPRWMQRRGANA